MRNNRTLNIYTRPITDTLGRTSHVARLRGSGLQSAAPTVAAAIEGLIRALSNRAGR